MQLRTITMSFLIVWLRICKAGVAQWHDLGLVTQELKSLHQLLMSHVSSDFLQSAGIQGVSRSYTQISLRRPGHLSFVACQVQFQS